MSLRGLKRLKKRGIVQWVLSIILNIRRNRADAFNSIEYKFYFKYNKTRTKGYLI